jgi:MYXO-CTERM domain-containing protein
VLGTVVALAQAARADDIAAFEHMFGATDINAAIGNGGATAGFSAQGEITVLRWPSPSYYQHVDFKTSTSSTARQTPHFGARDNQGSFAGVYVAPGPGGAAGQFLWARESGWTVTQAYATDDSNRLVTKLYNAAMRVTLQYTDVVAPDLDVLVRHIEVTPDAGFTPTTLRLVYFENFSPTIEKADFYPNDQTDQLASRDYALGMSARLGALVHFSVNGRPPALVAPLGTVNSATAVDAFFDTTIANQPGTDGMYLLTGGDRMPDGFQCGWDADAPPAGAGADAYADAIATSGTLSGSAAVLTHADGALRWDLPPAGGAVDVFIAMGARFADAANTLAEARQRGGDAIRAADQAASGAWLARATLPATDDPDRLRLAKRTLLSIAVGRDRATGAIVASISSQPPYDLDWPRDGSFIDYTLDLAGYHDWAEQHRLFYTTVQRKMDGEQQSFGDSYAGSFLMAYYADGRPGAPIPLEIDEVGLTLWGWYEHAKWIDEPQRTSYLNQVWSSIVLGADMLTSCVDPGTNLQCAENEDDNLAQTVTLHGAIPVRLGLASAARAAHYLGRSSDEHRWMHRLAQLDAAIEKAFGDPTLGYVGGDTSLGDVGAIGPVAWTIWPARFHDYKDSRIALSAKQVVDSYTPFFTAANAGGSYYGKGLVALARYDSEIGDATALARDQMWIDRMVKLVPTSTGHYGESFIYDGQDHYTNVVSIPHLWEASLTYLALMAAYSPGQFERPEIAPLDESSGCGCSVGARPRRSLAPLALIALTLALALRRRYRRPATTTVSRPDFFAR